MNEGAESMRVKNKDENELGYPIPTYHELTIHMIGSHVTLLFDDEDSREEFFWMAEARIKSDKPIFYVGKIKTLSCETKDGMINFNPRNITAIEVRK